MATIKLKFRTSKVNDKSGTLYFQICHGKKSKQITTGIHILPEQWNSQSRQIVNEKNNLTLRMYQLQIENDLKLFRRIIERLDSLGNTYQIEDILDAYRTSASEITLLYYMKQQIDELTIRRKYGTASNYHCALNSFSSFLQGRDIPISLINDTLIRQYSDWLGRREVRKNTISFYMRIWRAVYNKAVRENIVEQTFPFKQVYTGVDRTRKRAASEETILKLFLLDLKKHPSLELSRDLFVFSYYTRGMAFVDIIFLKKENIENGILFYHRRKTDQLLLIKIEPCMEQLIRKYQQQTLHSPYLFPVLTTEKTDEAYRQYQTALSYHNRKLKKLASLAGIPIPLSSYTPRHTWATEARNHNIPIAVISAGMGHTSEQTTRIYLDSIDNTILDAANNGLLEKFNKVISF